MEADRRIALEVVALAIVTYAWFFGGAGWNQDAQFDLTRALVERRTLCVDGYAVNTEDVSVGRHGHTYINKPPGVSMLAVIPYALVFAAEKVLHLPIDDLARANAWIVTAATCGVCGALVGATLFLYGRKIGASPAAALTVALSILFGTIVFEYSTMLFAHVPSALFLLLAFVWARDRPLLAGIAVGAATACFYVCALAAIALLIVTRRKTLHFVAGGLPFAALLAIYHAVCFGSPWVTSVEVSERFTHKGFLFGVFRLPTFEALWGLTFSPFRGLFYTSPVLLFAFVGILVMIRERKMVAELIAIAATAIVFIIVISGFNGWNGGWAFGPRYLLPIIPLLGVTMMFAATLARPLWLLLAALSVAINFIATGVGPMPPDTLKDPLRQWYLPIFSTGQIDGVKVGKVAVQREAGNLGEFLFGEKSRSSVFPILIWITFGTLLLLRASGRYTSTPNGSCHPL